MIQAKEQSEALGFLVGVIGSIAAGVSEQATMTDFQDSLDGVW